MIFTKKHRNFKNDVEAIAQENLRKLSEMPWLYAVSDTWNLWSDKIVITQDLAPLGELLGVKAKKVGTLSFWVEWECRGQDGPLWTGLIKIPSSEDKRCWASQIVRTINMDVNAIGHVVQHTTHMPGRYIVYRGQRYFEETFNNKIKSIAHLNEAANGFEKSKFVPRV